MAIHRLHSEEQLAEWRRKRTSDTQRLQMAKQPGQVTIYDVETGEAIHRWPVDATGMVQCGEYSYEPPEGVQPEGEEGDQEQESLGTFGEGDDQEDIVAEYPGGYFITKRNVWHKLRDEDGEQVGKSQRSLEDAEALLPATHRPGGEAPGTTAEHSPGVPLVADGGG